MSFVSSLLSVLGNPGSVHNTAECDSQLCEPCRSIFHGEYIDKPLGVTATQPFLQTLHELEVSATEHKCHLCFIRWGDLSSSDRESLQGCTMVTYGFWKSSVGDGVAFEYFYPNPPDEWKTCLTKSVMVKPIERAPGAENRRRIPSGLSTNDEKTFELARAWIDKCNETHPYCNRTRPSLQDRVLPDRLIEIRARGSAMSPRLYITKDLPRETEYMTLSHRWGNIQPLKLLRQNLEAFQEGIALDSLPKTFRDALLIASKLGIKYLWIDSLCIIQDSHLDLDWKDQASKMADIYHNSWCNIAASAAPDSRTGCFVQRSPMMTKPCIVEANWRQQPKRQYTCSSMQAWAVELNPLNSRGWVVQELILSPRTIFFDNYLLWECLELRASELFPDCLPNNRTTKTSLDPHSLRHQMIKAYSLEFQLYDLWALCLNRYSKCALSFPKKDKLLAVSGLARKLIRDGDQYVAGLWRNILPYQLMWTAGSRVSEDHTVNSDIPSWSWASLNGTTLTRVPSRPNQSTILIRNIEAKVELLGSDPFGQIKGGGLLRLEGPIAKTSIRRCIGMYRNAKWWFGTSLGNFFPDRESFQDGSNAFCLSIERNRDGSTYGIVLEPTGLAPGQFYRRGYFAVFDLSKDVHWVRDFHDLQRISLGSGEYESHLGLDSETGFQYYTISII